MNVHVTIHPICCGSQYMYKSLIIFDLDGTLIDSVPDLSVATNEMLMTLGANSADTEQVRGWVGNGSLKLTERALAWAGLPTDTHALEQAHRLFLTAYQAHIKTHQTCEYQGVTTGLDKLIQAGLVLAIATNKPTAFVPEILANMGWTDKFACVLGGDSLPTKKPDPAPLLYICDSLGIDTTQAVMVGDSTNDVQAGKSAGMTTLALSYGYNYGKPIADSSPDAVFDEFGALVDFILQDLTD